MGTPLSLFGTDREVHGRIAAVVKRLRKRLPSLEQELAAIELHEPESNAVLLLDAGAGIDRAASAWRAFFLGRLAEDMGKHAALAGEQDGMVRAEDDLRVQEAFETWAAGYAVSTAYMLFGDQRVLTSRRLVTRLELLVRRWSELNRFRYAMTILRASQDLAEIVLQKFGPVLSAWEVDLSPSAGPDAISDGIRSSIERIRGATPEDMKAAAARQLVRVSALHRGTPGEKRPLGLQDARALVESLDEEQMERCSGADPGTLAGWLTYWRRSGRA